MTLNYDRIGEKSGKSLPKRCAETVAEFGMGFMIGFYYRQKQTFDSSSKEDYTKKGIESLPNDKGFGGIGFSPSFIGYGLGSLAGHPLALALEGVAAYSLYQKFK